MSLYKGLWKKEMAMMRGFHILICLALLGIILYSAIQNRHILSTEWMVGIASISFIIFPVVLLFSLNMEKHQFSLFLFKRQQINKQIQIKFFHGFLIYSIYYIFIFGLAGLLHLFGWMSDSFAHTSRVLFVVFFFNLLLALLLSLSIYIAWVLHQWIREKAGFLVSVIALFIFFNILLSAFGWLLSNLSFLANWWTADVGSLVDIPFTIFTTGGRLSVSMVIIFLLISYLCYYLATWVLKRKVEA